VTGRSRLFDPSVSFAVAQSQGRDEYGQDLARFGVEVSQAVKIAMPEGMPLLMRISAIEYMDGDYDLEQLCAACAARFDGSSPADQAIRKSVLIR
jgi:2,4-dienoyl-CoA reductase-like NADH-dependent reductase (Old Yellow Enzyme family)